MDFEEFLGNQRVQKVTASTRAQYAENDEVKQAEATETDRPEGVLGRGVYGVSNIPAGVLLVHFCRTSWWAGKKWIKIALILAADSTRRKEKAIYETNDAEASIPDWNCAIKKSEVDFFGEKGWNVLPGLQRDYFEAFPTFIRKNCDHFFLTLKFSL